MKFLTIDFNQILLVSIEHYNIKCNSIYVT